MFEVSTPVDFSKASVVIVFASPGFSSMSVWISDVLIVGVTTSGVTTSGVTVSAPASAAGATTSGVTVSAPASGAASASASAASAARTCSNKLLLEARGLQRRLPDLKGQLPFLSQ